MQHKKTTTPLQAFTDRIERFAQRNPIRSGAKAIVDDLVQLQFNCLAHVLPVNHPFDGAVWFDDRYLIALDEYRDHPKAWADLVALGVEYQNLVAASVPFADLLSDFYGASIAPKSAKAQAQFMTPTYVADVVTRFALDKSAPVGAEPDQIADPTCGAGALLLAHLRHRFVTHGKAGMACTYVLANDIDPAMMRLATVQIGTSCLAHQVPLGGLMMYRANLIADYMKKDTLAVSIHPNVEQAVKHGHHDDVMTALQARASIEPWPEGEHLPALIWALAMLKATAAKANGLTA
jgi:hypothetical protein